MVEDTTTGHEDLVELLVVVDHHTGFGRFLGHGEEIVDILDRSEGFLP